MIGHGIYLIFCFHFPCVFCWNDKKHFLLIKSDLFAWIKWSFCKLKVCLRHFLGQILVCRYTIYQYNQTCTIPSGSLCLLFNSFGINLRYLLIVILTALVLLLLLWLLLFRKFFIPTLADGLSLEFESPQVSRTLFSILAVKSLYLR